jgi:hypothetical protein
VVVMPGYFSACVWSPGLSPSGNSLAGTRSLELYSSKQGFPCSEVLNRSSIRELKKTGQVLSDPGLISKFGSVSKMSLDEESAAGVQQIVKLLHLFMAP